MFSISLIIHSFILRLGRNWCILGAGPEILIGVGSTVAGVGAGSGLLILAGVGAEVIIFSGVVAEESSFPESVLKSSSFPESVLKSSSFPESELVLGWSSLLEEVLLCG